MQITIQKGKKFKVLLVPLCKEWVKKVRNEKLLEEAKNFMKSKLFFNNNVEMFVGNKTYFFVNLDKEKELTEEKVRRKMSDFISTASKYKIKELSIYLPIKKKYLLKPVIEGIMLSSYKFDKYKKEKEKKLEKISFIPPSEKKVIDETKKICSNVLLLRDMINERGNTLGINEIVKYAKTLKGISSKVLDFKDLKKLGLNLLIAVGREGKIKPKLLILEYCGSKEKPIVFVGKGVTFDTGGINLKPSGYIENMFFDKAGALTSLIILKTASELKLNNHLIAVLPLCENMIGKEAYKPGDIIKSYSGKSVEIVNTDAEGRLILADAVSYAIKKFKPKLLVEIATLTGSCLVVFGEYVAALITNNATYGKKLVRAGEKTYERIWELPLYDEYREEMKSDVADVKNIGYKDGKYAGTITAAAFIAEFVGNTPWIHLDIAGTASYETKRYYIPKDATGFGIRLFTEFLKMI